MKTNEGWSFGDLVRCEAAGGRDAVGLIAELRRADCRVLYLDTGSSVWAPLRSLRRAPEELTGSGLEALVARLLRCIGAVEMDFTRPAPGLCRLIASHGAITPRAIEAVRAEAGPRLRHHIVRPQGLHRIQTLIEFTFP